ncbi:hypothetical protein DFQ28_009113 [Apophysomyces sp. BC1034]|nr:hypothetical protein DFQ28_009113 [Apophysomyces sp. BC1034]
MFSVDNSEVESMDRSGSPLDRVLSLSSEMCTDKVGQLGIIDFMPDSVVDILSTDEYEQIINALN